MVRRVAVNGLCAQDQPRIVDGAADRGAAAEQLARRALDRGGERFCGGLVLDHHPRHHMDLQARAGPLQHGDGDRLRHAGADGVEHARIAERLGVALLLQIEAAHVDAAGGIDREHELKVDLHLGRRCFAGKQQERAPTPRSCAASASDDRDRNARASACSMRPGGR